jgi:hypothetical protein
MPGPIATVPDPPSNPLAPTGETLPEADIEPLEEPQFEKSAFGWGPKVAPAAGVPLRLVGPPRVVPLTQGPQGGLKPDGPTFPDALPGDEHAAMATELTTASAAASASRMRTDWRRQGGKPRNLG